MQQDKLVEKNLPTCLTEKLKNMLKAYWEVLITEEVEELVKSSTEEEEDKEETEAESAMWTLPKFAEVFWIDIRIGRH